jgi:hypothetical protein
VSEDPINPDTPNGAGSPDANGVPASGRAHPLAGLWARVVELEREARFLSAKCDELRHSCRDLLAEVGSPGPLTEDQIRSVRSDAPRLSQDEVFAEYRRLREERAAGMLPVPPGATAEQLSRRLADLQPAVAALASRRESLRPIFLALAGEVMPIEPPTEEEIAEFWRLAQGPPGPSIGDIIAEFEREHRP